MAPNRLVRVPLPGNITWPGTTTPAYWKRKPSAHDYLNAGHVEVCVGNMKRGVEFYLQSKQKAGDMELFQAMLYDDEKELKEAGVDTAILPIILDAMRYEEEKSDRDPAQE